VFADHSDSNVRVLVAAVLRRLTPTLVSYSVTAEQAADRKQQPGHGLIGNDGEDDSVDRLVAAREVCLRAVSRQAPTLLSDQAPVPQYTIRLLADICLSSDEVATTVCSELLQMKAIAPLVRLLHEVAEYPPPLDGDRDPTVDVDPQLGTLLQALFERRDCQQVALESGLATALWSSLRLAVIQSNAELIDTLLGLLQAVLSAASTALSLEGQEREDREIKSRGAQLGLHSTPLSDASVTALREQLAPLAQLVVPLLCVLADTVGQERNGDKDGSAVTPRGQSGISASSLSTASACLSHIADLFPEMAAQQLLTRDFALARDSSPVSVSHLLGIVIGNSQVRYNGHLACVLPAFT